MIKMPAGPPPGFGPPGFPEPAYCQNRHTHISPALTINKLIYTNSGDVPLPIRSPVSATGSDAAYELQAHHFLLNNVLQAYAGHHIVDHKTNPYVILFSETNQARNYNGNQGHHNNNSINDTNLLSQDFNTSCCLGPSVTRPVSANIFEQRDVFHPVVGAVEAHLQYRQLYESHNDNINSCGVNYKDAAERSILGQYPHCDPMLGKGKERQTHHHDVGALDELQSLQPQFQHFSSVSHQCQPKTTSGLPEMQTQERQPRYDCILNIGAHQQNTPYVHKSHFQSQPQYVHILPDATTTAAHLAKSSSRNTAQTQAQNLPFPIVAEPSIHPQIFQPNSRHPKEQNVLSGSPTLPVFDREQNKELPGPPGFPPLQVLKRREQQYASTGQESILYQNSKNCHYHHDANHSNGKFSWNFDIPSSNPVNYLPSVLEPAVVTLEQRQKLTDAVHGFTGSTFNYVNDNLSSTVGRSSQPSLLDQEQPVHQELPMVADDSEYSQQGQQTQDLFAHLDVLAGLDKCLHVSEPTTDISHNNESLHHHEQEYKQSAPHHLEK